MLERNSKTKAQTAKELFQSGCNCSQAVFSAFADDYGLEPKV